MRVHRIALVFLFVAWWPFAAFAADTQPELGSPATPELLVARALQAEANGEPEQRKALLDQAIADLPGFAPARWQSGFVRSEAGWLSIEEAATATVRAGKMK